MTHSDRVGCSGGFLDARHVAVAEVVEGGGRAGPLVHAEPAAAERARRTAENADRAAYADAVSGYAALGRDELREAARAVMWATSGRG